MLSSIEREHAGGLLVIGLRGSTYDIMRQSRGIGRKAQGSSIFREGRRSLDGFHHPARFQVARIGFTIPPREETSFAKI